MASPISRLAIVAVVAASCTGSDGTDSATGDSADTIADTGPNPAESAPDQGEIEWGPCDDLTELPGFPSPECSTLVVPLDHSQPEGDQIEIAVARYATADEAERIGSVVFNPGGPGGSGLDFLIQAVATVPDQVQRRFDLVSFDPRGVGASTALTCDVEIDDQVDLLEEGDDARWEELVDEAEGFADQCTADTLELAPYVGTNNAARDLDLLRAALGDDGLTYVGYSYGTRLGATYAELFPENVRALVLDAAVLPVAELSELDLGQAEGFDRALTNFAEACDTDEDCLLREIGPTLDVIEGLRAELDEVGTFPAGDDRVLTRGELDLGIAAALYSKSAWPFLAQALFIAETEQDGELLQVLADGLSGRRPDGTYDNLRVANGFINCADDPTRPSVEEVRAHADEAAEVSQFFDDFLRANTGCIGTPDPLDPIVIGPASDAPPIVVIGNTGDPATPYEWSVELAEQLDTAVLFSVEAEGHTAYGTIECVSGPINTYLIDLVVPEEGAMCSDNADADFFVPAGESEVDLVVALFDCLRDNGADLPEITVADVLADPTGETFGDLLDPNDPTIAAAVPACAAVLQDLQAST